MQSTRGFLLTFIFIASAVTWSAALAQSVARTPLTATSLEWIFLAALGTFAWASSRLPEIAGWIVGNLERRLTIVGNYFGAQLATGLAYFGSQGIGMSEAISWVAAGAFGFAGGPAIRMIQARFAPGAATPQNPGG